MASDNKPYLRLGVDVGGTNTDAVIIDTNAASPGTAVKAWHKTATTPSPSDGIREAMSTMLKDSDIDPKDISSVTIGTTHFVNAVVEADASKLASVAVIRLCGPFSKHVPPCIDWREDLREIILGHYALLKGGLEVDGHLISDINNDEIREQCRIIREKEITTVVVNGVFSPIDTVERQEERAADIIRAEIPGVDVVLSKEVANLGFIERENAAVLNASILSFARHTIRAFQTPIKTLGLTCPVFIAQNDGTVLSGDLAAKLPIKTFSSGPTNSMRGAAFLVQQTIKEDTIVVDIGGTTTDVGLLQANGFPRQRAAYSELEGIRMNFPGPDIKSIGLGGGSIVRKGKSMTVGPDSVGHRLKQEAVIFGGSTLTATDLAVLGDSSLGLGDVALLTDKVTRDKYLSDFHAISRRKIEKIIDTMKTSPHDLPVILVGGGAIIAPEVLAGASKVVKPEFASVANAIGAAMAKVSAVVDRVLSTEKEKEVDVLQRVKGEAVERAVQAGAERATTEIVEAESFPLSYVQDMTRFIVRAVGDFDASRRPQEGEDRKFEEEAIDHGRKRERFSSPRASQPKQEVDVYQYVPRVRDRVWYISETDLAWITTGCYILGTGGGGSPYSSMIRLRTALRNGDTVRVIDPQDLADHDQIGCGGGAGSPTVAIERLAGDETLEAQQEVYKMCEHTATHLISIEIGGANGLQSMILGASSCMDLPVVDGDWMGRAYPTKWQTTPVVFNERSPIWSPIAMSDGNGNVVTMPKAASDAHVEKIMRAALAAMGSLVGTAEPPVTGAETKRWTVENTISQSWRIGRGVARARKEHRMAEVAEAIIDECGGPSAGRVLWKGKIIGVERTLRNGHAYGECLIQGTNLAEPDDAVSDSDRSPQYEGVIKVPFKNENIAALRVREDGQQEQQEDVLGVVPDLITIIDAQSGEAIGTPEYRYGLLVVVLGLAASDKWTGSERGIKIGGPGAFGFDHLKWESLGRYVKPRSVIDEFDGALH